METELTKQWNSNLKSQAPLGIFGILRESFKTIKRNGKLLVPVLLLVFLLFSQLDIAQIYLLEPVARDFSLQLEENPQLFQDFGNNMHGTEYSGALKNIREMLLVNILTIISYLIISLVFFIATVISSYEAYTSKVLSPAELMLKMKNSWKNPTLTGFYFILILLGSTLVCIFSIGAISLFVADSSAYVLYGTALLPMIVLCVYVTTLWMMSMVVSVIEDVGGLNAIVRAQGLMKGKRVQAFLITVMAAVGYGLVDWTTKTVSSYNQGKWSVSIPFANGLFSMFKIFVFVVFTIFYHERKESSSDKKEAEGLYFPIAAGEI